MSINNSIQNFIDQLRRLFLAVMLMVFCMVAFGQSPNYSEIINYSPTTPEVASLGRFVETPVALYSGTPNISIPIASVSSGDLSVSVGLSYHAGGIRVEDLASWVGTGWNLTTGGSVTRVVRGTADDSGGGFLNTANTVQNFINMPKATLAEIQAVVYLINQAVAGNLDYEADVYHYSFSGYSGKFMMTQGGQIIVMPHADIKISPVKDSSQKIVGWIIVAPDGTKAHFGKSKNGVRESHEEMMHSQPLSGGRDYTRPRYITGWNLMDLTDHTDKNHIEFSYVSSVHSTCGRGGQQRFVNKYGEATQITAGIKPITYFENTVKTSKIASIKGANGTISFIKASNARQDLPGDYALSEIVLRENVTNNEIRKFKFNYENRQSPTSPLTIPCGGNERYHRLFLSSIQEMVGSSTLPPYVFTYNSTVLPDKFSYAQDFWGYYNGKTTNQHLIPTVVVRSVRWDGADRYSNEAFMKAGTLEKITYPTGGYTEFSFEANRVSQLAFAPIIADRTQVQILQASTGNLVQQNANLYTYSQTFTIVDQEYIGNMFFTNVSFPCDVNDRDCGIEFTLKKADNSFHLEITQNGSFYLTPGVYELSGRVTPATPNNPPTFFVRILGEKYNIPSNFQVGGLRVREVRNYDSNAALLTQKSYAYHQFNNEQISSGGITSTPVFVELSVPFTFGSEGAVTDIINSSSLNPFTSTQSNYVGYTQVIEYHGTKSSNTGKTEYEYSFAMDDDSGSGGSEGGLVGMISGKVAQPPPVVLEWLRGNLLKERHFTRTTTGAFTLIRETTNNYVYYRNPSDIFRSNVLSVKMNKRGDGMYGFERYNTLSEWFKLHSTTVVDHHPDGAVQQGTTYQYHQNAGKHVFPIATTVSRSGGTSLVERKFYPDDVTSTTSLPGGALTSTDYTVIGQLKKAVQHRIGEVIQTETWLNGTSKLSTQRTLYTNWGNNIIKPASISAAKGEASLEKRLDYLGYDEKANIREVALVGGPRTVYIRGYADEHVLAKIENATYDEVIATGVNLTVLNNINSTDVQKTAELNKIRSIGKAMVTTYLYKPLVGLTRQTDEAGKTTAYHYDTFGRLQLVRDHQGNIIEDYRYHYRTN